MPDCMARILAEIERAEVGVCLSYLHGAMRDGTTNHLHKTVRISQSDVGWLRVLQSVFRRLGYRSWLYREGDRNVWVVESTCRLGVLRGPLSPGEGETFVRGYFDADGGAPKRIEDRFYVQFVQRDRLDLEHVRGLLEYLGIGCDRIHNPSTRVAPGYWRFYVLADSLGGFIRRIGSWRPRKRAILETRAVDHQRRSLRTGDLTR